MKTDSWADFDKNSSANRHGELLGIRFDWPLIAGLLLLSLGGLVVIYSAGGEDISLMWRQVIRLFIAFFLMIIIAQIHPQTLLRWSPWLYVVGLVLLIAVLVVGDVGKGAQRWLDFGFFRFQPSEMMKVAVPMMVAWYLHDKPLPPSFKHLFIALMMIVVPTMLIAKQPDLGTSILIASSGLFVLLLAGVRWKIIFSALFAAAACAPVLWYFMRDYQKQRVLTFLNPENDPLGAGYHIIQSKIAIGSGGVYGKGWLNGTQSQLDFIPERSTDFIFAVYAEEFGFLGVLILLSVFLFIVIRGIQIALDAQNSYARLLAGSITITFFTYLFVNIGMVSGILPVVGVPLPLVSYGGTSMVTLFAAFGMLMSIQTHRKLLSG